MIEVWKSSIMEPSPSLISNVPIEVTVSVVTDSAELRIKYLFAMIFVVI